MNETHRIVAEKAKRKRPLWAVVAFFLREIRRFDRLLFLCMFLIPLPEMLSGYLSARLPSDLVRMLEQRLSASATFLPLALEGLALMLCVVAKNTGLEYMKRMRYFLPDYLTDRFLRQVQRMDSEQVDAPENKEMMSNAWGSAEHGRGFFEGTMITSILGTILSCLVFGWAIGRRSLAVLLIVTLSVVVNLYLLQVARRMHKKYYGTISQYAKGEAYITHTAMDPAAGMDIRIFGMLDFLIRKYDQYLAEIDQNYRKIHTWYFLRNLSGAFFGLLRDAGAYLYLVLLMSRGDMSVAEFIFLFGAMGQMAASLETAIRLAMDWNALEGSAVYFQEFLERESAWRQESILSTAELEALRRGLIVELRNVSYRYPETEKTAISHVNLTLRPGEKLALIGLNGAGKTTLVKLIAGLISPTEGEILISGHPRSDFTREEYTSLLSVMFQDSLLLPTDLDSNLTAGAERQPEKLRRALFLAGAEARYDTLPAGGKTRMDKTVHPDAIDFSGGEKQRFLFARAIYREAPLTILDEPTAALDPLAEYEMYQHFGEAMAKRSVLFISHRLSSTRFCDRILLMEQGRIQEEGTHQELLERGGRYAQLFEMQRRYYQEEKEKAERVRFMED